jgi:hypothetical protein
MHPSHDTDLSSHAPNEIAIPDDIRDLLGEVDSMSPQLARDHLEAVRTLSEELGIAEQIGEFIAVHKVGIQQINPGSNPEEQERNSVDCEPNEAENISNPVMLIPNSRVEWLKEDANIQTESITLDDNTSIFFGSIIDHTRGRVKKSSKKTTKTINRQGQNRVGPFI